MDRDDGRGSTATVVLTSEHSARVDMRDESGRHAIRDVTFRVEDPVEDRWQTIALLVASLGGELTPPPPPPPPRDDRAPHVLWLTVLGEAGDGVVPGPPRFGGSARLAFRPRGFIGYFTAGAGYATSVRTEDGVRPSWMPFSLGMGAVIEFEATRLALRPRLDFVMERQAAQVTGAGVGEALTSGSRWLPGAGVSLDLVIPTASPVGIVFGGNALFVDGGTTIRLRDERVASFPAHSYAVQLGVDVTLDALFGLARD